MNSTTKASSRIALASRAGQRETHDPALEMRFGENAASGFRK
jgi:hypothetical protein